MIAAPAGYRSTHDWLRRAPIDSVAFREQQLAKLPPQWAIKLRRKINKIVADGAGERDANLLLLDVADHCKSLLLPPAASDADLCDFANRCATETSLLLADTTISTNTFQRASAHLYKNKVGVPVGTRSAVIARMLDPLWWRRQLRRVQARDVEAYAIKLGFVQRRGEKYVSDESLKRRAQQLRRNRRMLENTTVENEDGEQFSLAQLSDKGLANSINRRNELMCRIRGMEDVAKAKGFAALFATITCPSRFHRINFDGTENEKYDGSTPHDAQQYLCGLWARIRAKIHRLHLLVTGLRVAEPHHDGCPHWHLLLFVAGACAERRDDDVRVLRELVSDYALQDHGDERGAAEHRCKFVEIDPSRGSAAGYVAKYISKTVGVEPTLHCKDDARVPGWAATNGIRQFQFFGGPPIGTWRELRKVPYQTIAKAKQTRLKQSWQAANRRDLRKADFGAYIAATGGATLKRHRRHVQLVRAWSDRPGRYGDPIGWQPIGVALRSQPRHVYFSVRRVWTLIPRTRVINCTLTVAQKIGNIKLSDVAEDLKNFHPPPKDNHATPHPRSYP